MKRSPINKIGAIGRANQEARKLIAEKCEELGLNYCEIHLDGCTGNWPLAPAHKEKRSWYKGNVELLADYEQWVCACQNCHAQIEHNKALTEEVFARLRGKTTSL